MIIKVHIFILVFVLFNSNYVLSFEEPEPLGFPAPYEKFKEFYPAPPDEEHMNESNYYLYPIDGSFYPLGWSKDGKFAYFDIPPCDECDDWEGNLCIQDLRSDKKTWLYYHNNYDYKRPGYLKFNNLKDFFSAKEKIFNHEFNKHGIIRFSKFELLNPPVKFKNDLIKIMLTKEIEKKHDPRTYPNVEKIKLELFSQKQGKKTVYEEKIEYSRILDASIAGYIKSPFEDRIVIFLQVIEDFQPKTINVIVIGASLQTGFKKQKAFQ